MGDQCMPIGNLGNLGDKLPNELGKYLKGIDFPADKQEVVQQAESNQAEGSILDALKQLPPGVYDSIGDIAKQVGGGDLLKGLGSKH